MEAIALILSKFSEELIGAQLALLFFTSSVAVYWLLVRKKKKESAEWVPAALVRAYLDRMQADERATRLKLFGEQSAPTFVAPLASALASATATGVDPNLVRELEALRSQLTLSDQRAMEFDRTMNAIKAEKAALEQKLKEAQAAASAGTAPATVDNPATQKELEDLRARLQEYEVIEDDLANLKKFQKENEQLRQKVESYEKGGTVVTTAIPAAAAAAEPKMVVSGGGEPNPPIMTLVSGGASKDVTESTTIAASAPIATAETKVPEAFREPVGSAPGAETNTNVLAPVNPTVDSAAAEAGAPAAEAGPEKSTKQKEEELLSEFEKMLAS